MSFLSKKEIYSLLQKYSVRPDKKRGQSFLTNRYVAKKIVDAAKISDSDIVLEIGGGLGILSEWLAKYAQKLFIIEIETGLVQALKDLFEHQNHVAIIEGDALEVDFPRINKVVANLPYSISSEITFRILKKIDFEVAILMYQKEFADRLVAKPGSRKYSRLTIDFQYYAHAEKIMDVPSNAFYPEPAVTSTVVKITKREEKMFVKSEDVFFKLVHGIYPYPKKQLGNALKIWLERLDLNSDLSRLILKNTAGIEGNERLREIPQESLIRISNTIADLIQEGRMPNL
ncbi:MAG: ribosomal RNA small subunit methyltransferase A [Candidatus Lokiarchaeota archaeon]|nr:ribosomal RNA small subunit methyltransferase A [Candidatus Lokiarchaeota archaeon]